MTDITKILADLESGDDSAAEKLLPLVYDELRKLAAAKLSHEKPGQTIQATELVHDARNSLGAEFSYNNTGFALLAEVVERVGKKPFPEWMSENVFQPLEMSDTFVRANPRTIIKRTSMGYAPDKNGNYRESPDLGAAVGAGGIYTTIGDLAKWIKNYRTG